MVSPQLLEYVRQQQAAGYTDQKIAFALSNAGYAQEDIIAAIHQQPAGKHDADVHASVEQYARMGYSSFETTQYLLQQGMNEKEVRRAIKDVYGVGSTNDVPHMHIFLFSFLALILGAAIMYFVMQPGVAGPPTNNVVDPGTLTYSPSEIINDVIELTRRDGADAGISSCTTRLVHQNRDLCYKAVATMEEVDDMTLCSQIMDAEIHDSCYMSFLNKDFEGACAQMQLAKSQETCNDLRALKS